MCTGKFFAGGVGKDQVADFAAGAGVILADVLGYPQGKLAMRAHKAQQIGLPEETDFARFLSLGRGFILASRNYSGNSQGATGLDDTQNQGSAVAATNGKLHPAATNDEHS